MSASEPARRQGQLRTVDARDARAGAGAPDAASRAEMMKCSYRPADADFYCWKYGVWYNVMDCCYRHDQKTFEGCADCGQGERNLKVHWARYSALRLRRRSTLP